MHHCPTCNARYKGKASCHRCGTDLARLVSVEDAAADYRQKAIIAYEAGDFQAMYHHAKRAYSLCRKPGSEKLLACAALAAGLWETALAIWKQYQVRP